MTAATMFGSFTVTRLLKAKPGRVFEAWSTEEGKNAWFGGPPETWTSLERKFDFRVGGQDKATGRFATSGVVTEFASLYREIVPDTRIVYVYDMALDGKKISVSLATIEFFPEGGGTRLNVTEQGTFLDGYEDKGGREHGTNFLIDRLVASVDG